MLEGIQTITRLIKDEKERAKAIKKFEELWKNDKWFRRKYRASKPKRVRVWRAAKKRAKISRRKNRIN